MAAHNAYTITKNNNNNNNKKPEYLWNQDIALFFLSLLVVAVVVVVVVVLPVAAAIDAYVACFDAMLIASTVVVPQLSSHILWRWSTT